MSQGEVTNSRARSLIREMASLRPKWVIVEGGEPLLREDLFELLESMRHEQLDVHLITNGMLLDAGLLNRLASLDIKVMISIDGATAATYEAIRCGAGFDKVLENARRCSERGILEAINFTVMRANYKEIPGIFETARSVGVNKINIIGFKPCQGYPGEMLGQEEYTEAIRLACQSAAATGIGLFFDEPFFWAVVKDKGFSAGNPASEAGIVSSSTTACIFGEYLFIEPDGDVKPCSFAPMVLGNVNEKRLDTIWHEALDSPFLSRIKDPKTRTGRCRSCRHLEDCKGCRSRTFKLTGDWFASDPCCPLPFESK
jgi:radical SAM protein with 4Fe4S-binding SPASM domain